MTHLPSPLEMLEEGGKVKVHIKFKTIKKGY